jgi:hypothetical protein
MILNFNQSAAAIVAVAVYFFKMYLISFILIELSSTVRASSDSRE